MNIILTQEFKRAQIYDAIFIFLILTEIPFCWNNLPPDLIYSIVVTGSEISNQVNNLVALRTFYS